MAQAIFEDKSELVRRAYIFAENAHQGQKRANGDDYFVHCIEIANILNKLGLDDETIAAGLLHDILEDTNISLEELKKEFGKDVAEFVDGVTKINVLRKKSLRTNNSETIRKMLVSAVSDIRVIIIKLADRLHNIRTLRFLNEERKKKFCRETIDIYAPLADRLGLANIKWELEDSAFSHLEPEIYNNFKNKIAKTVDSREKEIENIIKELDNELKKHNLDVKILGRPKHFYSIYKKMKLKNYDFDKIQDLIGLRIITKNVEECYSVLGIVHNFWHPVPNRLKDYIANPKLNFYQSLHTYVLTNNKQNIEIQIRTKEMEDIAEEGIAAHWRYKGINTTEKFDKRLSWLRQILDFNKESPSKFMKTLKIDLFGDNIFCFTPKGDVIELANKSTPIDFAYAVHSDIGDKAVGARINDKFASLRYELQTGDVVEILTSKSHKPSRDWLKFVRTSKAFERIKHSLKLYQGLSAKKIKIINEDEKLPNSILYVKGLKKFDIRFSYCCNPLPGDEIVGYVANNVVVVHNNGCKNLSKIRKNTVDVKWLGNFNIELKIRVYALDRVGLFADILNTIAATGTTVKLAKAKTIDDCNAECILTIKFDGFNHLKDVLDRVKKIADVKKVRIE